MAIRFGTFEFDPGKRELRRDGNLVRLQPQPAKVLALLLERAGQLVSREDLRTALWGTDTFVDFDRSLNFCIAQIRSAVRDSADSPLYIKTVPKQGYQFIPPVSTAIKPAAPEPTRTWPRLAFLTLLTAALISAAVIRYRIVGSPVHIAVARFDNLSSDPDFDRFTDALGDAVIGELSAAGDRKYAVVGNAAILRTPRPQRDLLAFHREINAELVLLGDVQRDSNGVHVFAQLIGLPDQVHLKVTRIHTTEPNAVKAQAELARRIVHDLSPGLTHRAIQ